MSITSVYYLEEEAFSFPTQDDYDFYENKINLNVLLKDTIRSCHVEQYPEGFVNLILSAIHEYGISSDRTFLDRLRELTIFVLGGTMTVYRTGRTKRVKPNTPSKLDCWFGYLMVDDRARNALVVDERVVIRECVCTF